MTDIITDEILDEIRDEAQTCLEIGIAFNWPPSHVLALLARLDKAEAGWQDISTAPKDTGGAILLYGPQSDEPTDVQFRGNFISTGYWDGLDEAWCATGSDWTGTFLAPTHWRPLPPPPIPKEG